MKQPTCLLKKNFNNLKKVQAMIKAFKIRIYSYNPSKIRIYSFDLSQMRICSCDPP